MANPEHLKILKQGVEIWNKWRFEHPEIQPDLDHTDFSGLQLSFADLSGANLDSCIFPAMDLRHVNFVQANLWCASLRGSNLWEADLCSANLRDANLVGTNLCSAELNEADLTETSLGFTSFVNNDLSRVIGLEKVMHHYPSPIGIDTLYKSQGKISDTFLRGAGVPEEIIEIARSIRAGPPIQWYSCFISYSSKDDEFARRLHSRMREANMRVWFAPEDLKGGKKLHEQLFEAIQVQDRLLLVLSEHSIKSEWVMTEIRKAREVEKKEKRRKLFPIRLTDFETLLNWTCFDADTGKDLAVEVREYFIPDFSNWKNHDAFESAFARLKKDLETENSKKP
ncbi:MAG: toll/interleukin-1 receptor domain-containing protein [Verrucomicrobiota bacterium]